MTEAHYTLVEAADLFAARLRLEAEGFAASGAGRRRETHGGQRRRGTTDDSHEPPRSRRRRGSPGATTRLA